MPKVIITAQVDDGAKWDANFRTHDDVRKSYGLGAPVHYAINGNEVTLCMEPTNLETFMTAMRAPATVSAMASDGVKAATVKMVVLDKNVPV